MVMDADLQDLPEDVPRLLAAMDVGAARGGIAASGTMLLNCLAEPALFLTQLRAILRSEQKRFDCLYLPIWDLALERLDRFRCRR